MLCLIVFNSCDSTPSDIPVGKWKDDNSVIEYFENKTWKGAWKNGAEFDGRWELSTDTLWMYRTNQTGEELMIGQYKIIYQDDDEFHILSLKIDKSVFYKTRVK